MTDKELSQFYKLCLEQILKKSKEIDAEELERSQITKLAESALNTEYVTLELNKYQKDNLLWMFEVAQQLHLFNSGDWFYEIKHMLSPDGKLGPSDRPNHTVEYEVKRIKERLK